MNGRGFKPEVETPGDNGTNPYWGSNLCLTTAWLKTTNPLPIGYGCDSLASLFAFGLLDSSAQIHICGAMDKQTRGLGGSNTQGTRDTCGSERAP